MQAIFNIDNNQINVEFDPTKLPTKVEYVLVGGESDEDFHSRRNTFVRWLVGLPKKRNESIGRFPVPPKYIDVSLKVKTEDLEIFREWIHRDFGNLKSECIIHADDKTYTFLGAFPSELIDDGNVKLSYDCYRREDRQPQTIGE